MEPVLVERALRGRTKPHVIVHAGGRVAIGHLGDIPHPALISPCTHQADLPELAAPDILHRLGEMERTPLLGPHLDNPVMLSRRRHHGSAFTDADGKRLLYIDVFTRLAGEDGGQRVPMVRRAHDDGIDVLAVKHGAEITRDQIRILPVLLGDPGASRGALAVVHVAQRYALDARILEEIAQVRLAHSPATDQADADAIVAAGHSRNRCCALGCQPLGAKD